MEEDAQQLASRLSTVLSELQDVMQKRKDRIEELRNQVAMIEQENDDLEKRIQELIMDAF
jgi:predicted  nucleic acid-binding Zn-ribbon protein